MGLLTAYVLAAGVITTPAAPPASASAPNVSIADIASRPQPQDSPVTVRATLTINDNPAYIQDSTGGAEVEGLSAQELKIGDEVLVTGDPQETDDGLLLRNSRAKLVWHGSPLPPLSVTAGEAALGKFADLLMEG